MSVRKFLLGCASGFVAGYAACRALQALTPSREPAAPTRDAATYGRIQRALALAGVARALGWAATAAFGPAAMRLDAAAQPLRPWLRPMFFASAMLLAEAIVDLPAEYLEGYCLERRFGLSEQSQRSWFADRAKEQALLIGITGALAGLIGALVRRKPRAWAAIASAGTFPLLVFANVAVPLYILPLFNRYQRIEGPLERRLRALAARFGVGDAEILRVDMSKQTKKANAFVTGIGRVHRIVAGDTLLEHFSEDEIEFVVAHELGHYVMKDSWRMIACAQAAATICFFGSFYAVRASVESDRAVIVARIHFWSMLLGQLLRPAICAFARSREWAADRFAVAATGTPQIGVSAFRRLRDQNLAEEEQPGWFEFFFSTHPSLKKRIEALHPSRTSG